MVRQAIIDVADRFGMTLHDPWHSGLSPDGTAPDDATMTAGEVDRYSLMLSRSSRASGMRPLGMSEHTERAHDGQDQDHANAHFDTSRHPRYFERQVKAAPSTAAHRRTITEHQFSDSPNVHSDADEIIRMMHENHATRATAAHLFGAPGAEKPRSGNKTITRPMAMPRGR